MTRPERTVIKTQNIYLNLPLLAPSSSSSPPPTKNTRPKPKLIFFITGNPGLIGYYHEFLDCLVSSSPSRGDGYEQNPVVVAGYSLGGFEIESESESGSGSDQHPSTSTSTTIIPPFLSPAGFDSLIYPSGQKEIYSLQDQIELCYDRVALLSGKILEYYHYNHQDPKGGGDDDGRKHQNQEVEVEVMLMGHSVGAYIAMEMVRKKHHQKHKFDAESMVLQQEEQEQEQETKGEERVAFTLSRLVLLTPTILRISHSSSGRLVTPVLSTIPFFPSLVQFVSTVWTSVSPPSVIRYLVSRVTGMKMGGPALDATVAFVRARHCVRQSLFLATDEMREIGGDRWGEEVWGVLDEDEEQGKEGRRVWRAPKMYMLFAKSDHWVADATRDEIMQIIETRFGKGDDGRRHRHRPDVVVDEDGGLVHAWCIGQSDMVARRVKEWIDEFLNEL